MTMHARVGTKLITQNLLVSAAFYETGERLTWASIQDLCALINLFCLFDNVTVLGREANPHVLRKNNSRVFEVLDDQEFVQIHDAIRGNTAEEISLAARSHLRSVLPANTDVNRYDNFLRDALNPHEVWYGLINVPDHGQDFGSLPEWLVNEPSYTEFLKKLENEIPRSYTFMARTFLYLGYADVGGFTFVPDTTRIPVVQQICDREEDLRQKLLLDLRDGVLEAIREANREQPRPPTDKIWDVITPLAAIVFSRAKAKSDIARQMAELRYDLRDVRGQLKKLETAALGGGTREEEKEAQAKWKELLDEIGYNFNTRESLISWRALLNFGVAVSNVIIDHYSIINWLGMLTALPTESIAHLIKQRPIIEIHGLKPEIPGTLDLKHDVNRLFGTVMPSSD
jgi:hypothetical protein